MDAKAIRRAALITLRRAIRERFARGPERTAWLQWPRTAGVGQLGTSISFDGA
jgi:hypothetical protein